MTRDEVAGAIIAGILRREGGIAQLEGESFVTRFGQTPGWLVQLGFTPPTTPAEAEANYRTWLVRTKLIGLCDHADVLADAVIDMAVHAGHPAAIKALQTALGETPDGVLGPETQAAIEACDRRRTGARVVATKERLNGRLITGKPAQYAQWAAGWGARQAEHIEALGDE